VRNVGYPDHHDVRCVSVRETLLNREPVKGFRIIRRPDLLDQLHDSEVNASAATRTRLDLQGGMFLAKAVNNVINILREPHPNIFLLGGGRFRPSRLSEIDRKSTR